MEIDARFDMFGRREYMGVEGRRKLKLWPSQILLDAIQVYCPQTEEVWSSKAVLSPHKQKKNTVYYSIRSIISVAHLVLSPFLFTPHIRFGQSQSL